MFRVNDEKIRPGDVSSFCCTHIQNRLYKDLHGIFKFYLWNPTELSSENLFLNVTQLNVVLKLWSSIYAHTNTHAHHLHMYAQHLHAYKHTRATLAHIHTCTHTTYTSTHTSTHAHDLSMHAYKHARTHIYTRARIQAARATLAWHSHTQTLMHRK